MKVKQLLLILVLITSSAFANVKSPLLYKITKDGISSYMLGTIHISVNLEDLPSIVHEKFEEAEMFAMETNIYAMDQTILQNYQLYPEGDSLRNHISEETFLELVQYITHIPVEQLEQYKPWVINSIITGMMAQDIKNGPEGLDFQLQTAASEAGKTLSYMESWVHQLSTLDRLITPDVLEEIISGVTEGDSARVENQSESNAIQDMLDLYRAGDQEGLCEMILSAGEEQNEILIYERNRNWIGLIDMMHYNYENAFIAVGAGHFCGEQGVFELLEKRGYTVKRILQ